MKINPVNPTNFKQVVETHRKDYNKEEEENENVDVYEATVTYTETIKIPKKSETLQKIDYMI